MDQPIASHGAPTGDPQITALLKERVHRLALAWFPDHPETHGADRLLVLGVAAWSIYDVRLLTFVGDAVAGGAQPDLHVSVFDVDKLASSAELQRIFPGIGEGFHTPVAGYWEAGQLKETASGFAARQLIGRLLRFDPKSGLEHYTTAG
jgi:hypothetical protein